MFNLEIKRISLKSIVLSVYPFVIFFFTLIASLLRIQDLLDASNSLIFNISQLLLYSLFTTAVIVLFTVLAGFIYNMLTGFGMKGLSFVLRDMDEEQGNDEESTTEEKK